MRAIVATALLLLMSAAAFGQVRAPQPVIAEAERLSKDTFPFLVKSRKGVSVYGAVNPDQKMLDAIDKGFADLFAIAKRNKYKKRLKYSDYTVFIAKADRQKDYQNSYSPDIAVPAMQYKGTDYDKGGFIYAAGIVVAFQPCAFMIAEHTTDFNRVSDVVRFEGEHIVLFHNDRKRYQETADHSKGGSHPILQ